MRKRVSAENGRGNCNHSEEHQKNQTFLFNYREPREKRDQPQKEHRVGVDYSIKEESFEALFLHLVLWYYIYLFLKFGNLLFNALFDKYLYFFIIFYIGIIYLQHRNCSGNFSLVVIQKIYTCVTPNRNNPLTKQSHPLFSIVLLRICNNS